MNLGFDAIFLFCQVLKMQHVVSSEWHISIFLDLEGGSQKVALFVVVVVVVVVVVISSLKIPKAFLIRSRAQLNCAYTFVLTFPTDLPSQIFKLISN